MSLVSNIFIERNSITKVIDIPQKKSVRNSSSISYNPDTAQRHYSLCTQHNNQDNMLQQTRLPQKLEYTSVGAERTSSKMSMQRIRSSSGSGGQGITDSPAAFRLALEKDDRISKISNITQILHNHIFQKFKQQHERFLLLYSYDTVHSLKEVQDLYNAYMQLKYKIASCCIDFDTNKEYNNICALMQPKSSLSQQIMPCPRTFESYSSSELTQITQIVNEIMKELPILKAKFKELKLRFSVSDEILNARKRSLLISSCFSPESSPPIYSSSLNNFKLD